MSGNSVTENWWSVPVKHDFMLGGYPSVKAALIGFQKTIKSFSRNGIRNQTVSGLGLDSQEVKEVSDADWRNLRKEYDKYGEDIYCIPHTGLSKIETNNINFVPSTVSKIVALITERDEIIFFLILQLYAICSPLRPIVLTPGLEAEAKADLIRLAEEKNDILLKNSILQSTFAKFDTEINYKTNPIICTNFRAVVGSPSILDKSEKSRSAETSPDLDFNLAGLFSDNGSTGSLHSSDFFEVPSSSNQPQYMAHPKPLLHSPQIQPKQYMTPLQQAILDLKFQQEQQQRAYAELLARIERCQTEELLLKRLSFGDSAIEDDSAAAAATTTSNKRTKTDQWLDSEESNQHSTRSKGKRRNTYGG